jgi:hypothetical protein
MYHRDALRRATRSVIHLGAVAVVLAVTIFAGVHAAAQGAEQLLSQPIRSSTFNVEVLRLKLDYSQRLAAEAAHERYKAKYREFRDSEIESMERRMQELEGAGGRMPARKDIEEVLRLKRTLQSRMNTLDKELFDEIEAILRPEQLPALARLRRSRERVTYELDAISGPMGGNLPANLLAIVDELQLDDAAWQSIDEPLVEYEIAINLSLRALHDKTLTMFLDMFTILEEMGFLQPEFDQEDPAAAQEEMMKYMQAFQQAMQKVSGDVTDASKAAHAVTERCRTSIMAALPADVRPKFEEKYLEHAYPEVYADWEKPTGMAKAVEKIEGISESEKAAVRGIIESWKAPYDGLCRRMRALVDEQRERGPAQFSFGGEDMQEHWRKMQELSAERSQLNSRTAEQILAAITNEEARDRLAAFRHHTDDESIEMMLTSVNGQVVAQVAGGEVALSVEGGVFNSATLGTGYPARGIDTYLPAAITPQEFSLYAAFLGLTEDIRVIADDFLAAYRQKYDELSQGRLQSLIMEPMQKRYTNEGPDVNAAKALEDGRKEAFAMIRRLDEEFFAELSSLLTSDQQSRMPQVLLARERICYDLGAHARVMWHEGGTSIDLSAAVPSLSLTGPEIAALAPVLSELNTALLPLVKDQHKTYFEHEMKQIEGQALLTNLQNDPAANMEAWQKYNELMQPTQKRLSDLEEQRAAVERDAAPKFAAALPPAAAAVFERRQREAKYPNVYPDHDNAQPVIERALTLDGVSDFDRGRLEILLGEHMRGHDELCLQLIAIADESSRSIDWANTNPEEIQAYQRRMARREILTFDREEWNETTRRSARAILTEEQAKRVPGLDRLEPGVAQGMRFMMSPGVQTIDAEIEADPDFELDEDDDGGRP